MSDPSTAKTIAYVEDDPDNLHLVQLILEATGRYMVLGAADGLAGLDLVREKRPVLVLVDLDLPLIDGFELIKRIRLDPELRAIPLVAVSASVMHRERQRSLDAGCMAFVEKPFDVVAFRDLVDDCIRRAWDRER